MLDKVKALLRMHSTGALGGDVMPEDALKGTVPAEELPDVLTLGMALNYQRDSYKLWQAVAQAYRDADSHWIFNPRKVSASEMEELRDALLRHRVALQPNRHPETWQRVAKGVAASSAQGNVLGLIESAGCDIAELKTIMQNTRKSEFPLSLRAENF